MQPFETLTYNEQLARLTDAAQTALNAYDPNLTLHSVSYVNNAVFEVRAPDGGHFALRLHRPGHKSLEWIQSELVLLTALSRDTSLCVPHPIPTADGAPFVYASVDGLNEPVVCALLAWIEGHFETPDHVSLDQVRQAGEFLSSLHHATMRFEPPEGFDRPRLDERGLSGEGSAYNPNAGGDLFTVEDRKTFRQVEERVRGVMHTLDHNKEAFGLIHADFLMKNIVFRGDTVCAIDFDDCSWGYYLYDLAPLMLQFKDEPRYHELRDALWAGYTARHFLPEAYRGYLESFVAARHMFSCWWVAGNLHNPRIRERAPELIRNRMAELRRFLETGSISQQGDIF